jgi:hypothetical protein
MSSILEAIGNTPLVELSRLTRSLPGRLLLKLDYLNPGFSKKDRAALGIIEQAPFVAVMSRGNSPERAQMMRALGAEVVLVNQAPGSPHGQVSGEDLGHVAERAEELTRERGAFRADQFVREGNWHAHAETTVRKSCSSRAAWMGFAILWDPAAPSAVALRRTSACKRRLCAAMWSSLPAPLYSPDAKQRIPITASRVVVTPIETCPCCKAFRSMAISKSPTRKL